MGPYATSGDHRRDGRGPALSEAAHPPQLRHAAPGQVRHAVPGGALRARADQDGAGRSSSTRWPPPPTLPRRSRSSRASSRRPSSSPPARATSRPQRGLKVVLYLEYEFGTRDFGPIAARHQGRQPGPPLGRRASASTATCVLEELKRPRLHAAPPLSPLPGAGAHGHGAGREAGALRTRSSRSIRRSRTTRRRREIRDALPRAAAKAGVPYTNVDTQAAGSYAAWQMLEAAVTAHQEPRRQGARPVAPEEPGSDDRRPVPLRRAEQLRRRSLEGEAGAGRQVGRGVAEGVRARRAPGSSP